MRSVFLIALGLCAASPAAAQTGKAANAAQFVMQAWNHGGARVSLCTDNRFTTCAFMREDRKVVVTQGATPCILEIQWPADERGGAKFRVNFSAAGVQRLTYEPDLQPALYIQGAQAATPESDAAFPEIRWLRVESGAMNDRVLKALRALVKGCRDKSLGF